MASKFNVRFVSLSLILGGLMVIIGWLIMPVHVVLNFNLEMLNSIKEHHEFWVRSFQVMVFGLFIRIIALVSLGSLYSGSEAKPIVSAGIMVCSLAMLLTAISEGYIMHTGGWAQWKMGLIPTDQHAPMLAALELTNEWVSCMARMGRMFLHLGLVVLGWGIMRGDVLNKWMGTFALILGIAGITILMIIDQNPTIYYPLGHAVTSWFIIAGVLLFRKNNKT
ncbi:MAG: hypothetical protein M3Q56_06210 [Bacteroidota bacterium]|nr:hypothetical protein [Bacteroidota bacterium]